MLEIKETTIEDIKCVQQLWADGDVMKFVGFPDGLHETDERMQNWLRWIESNRPTLNHYSIFEDGKYCGESFYEIDAEHQSAALDIIVWICTGTWNCNGRALPCDQRSVPKRRRDRVGRSESGKQESNRIV